MSSLYILDISALLDVGLLKIFSHFVGCRFVLLMVSFALQNHFNLMGSYLLIIDLTAWAIDAVFRKLSSVPMHSRLSPTFSSIRFSVSSFMLRSLIVTCRVIDVVLFTFYIPDVQLLKHHLLKKFSLFSLYITGFIIKNHVFIAVWI